MPTDLARRPDHLADTALRLIAGSGLRGLTHRAVDAAAGVPLGSTSYYFRSRDALVTAAVGRLVVLDLAELDAMPLADRRLSRDELATLGVGLLCAWTSGEAWRHLARYELLLEGRRRPAIAAAVGAAGERLRESFAELLAVQGVAQPDVRARWFVAAIDGLVLDSLAGPGAAHRRTQQQWYVVARDLVEAVYRDPSSGATGD